ncbi:MAG: hypothetical protein ACYCOU_23520, partial [Sulfobacillus sp.]
MSFSERICAGGVVCLLAIAREEDYLLILQERSAKVLNAVGRLAVVPKAFHQPLIDFGGGSLASTVNRELEEELLGRKELDQISLKARKQIAPGHLSALSKPMRWLHDHADSYRLKCTAFGINMLSGNYEVACLVIIDDPTWWATYAASLRTNWEIGNHSTYSTLDTDGIEKVIRDPRWSNEGLFAFLEGLRSLALYAPKRVQLPNLEVNL